MLNSLLILLFILPFLGCRQIKELQWLTAEYCSNGISIKVNDTIRFSKGQPIIENKQNHIDSISILNSQSRFFEDEKLIYTSEVNCFKDSIWTLSLSLNDIKVWDGSRYIGFVFNNIPGFEKGIEMWRYKPWNSWTKPLRIDSLVMLHDWDVQFFYWQYSDGLYGAAIPLSGKGYRTTLGQENGRFGCKAYTYTQNAPTENIPMMAIGVGKNPYQLFHDLYQEGLKEMGKSENNRELKHYPEALEHIGWCTWNSSHNGQFLDEKHLIDGVSTFTENDFPLGWLLIDDGWFDQTDRRLNSIYPTREKFPNGFKPLVSKLKNEYKLKDVGIWHAYNGYWNGINPKSKLGIQYKNELFSWSQLENILSPNSKMVTYSFIRPDSDLLYSFYDTWHKYFADEGFSFVKVDNQLINERMCVDNYPIFHLSEKMHEALYTSVTKYFNGAIINCMDMTNEAFYNFGKSAIARCVEDYFPEKDGGIGYNLERGGAAAHVLSALYNSLYFSEMVWPDFDMFESHNSHAYFHAIARAVSGGPVYLTDIPSKQNFDVLWPLIDANGRILRADKPALITKDCMFQIQDKKPFKAFSLANNAGLLAAFNAADADTISGEVSPKDVVGLKGDRFAVHEYFSKEVTLMNLTEKLPIELNRMECKYFNIVPIQNDVAIFGLVNKYNASKTIIHSELTNHKMTIYLNGGGIFKAVIPKKPLSVLINGNWCNNYSFKDQIFTVETGDRKTSKTKIVINI